MTEDAIRATKLPEGEAVPVLGQGTWYLGEGLRPRAEEIATLRLGIDLGMSLIDTAEMYGEGVTEELVCEAVAGRRDEVFLVSKVLPEQELRMLKGGAAAATDQVLYNLNRRGLEWDLLPWCREVGMPIMAYSPIEQGRLLGHPVLREVAARHDATTAQVALAWALRHADVIAIPKAGDPRHVRENRAALDVRLSEQDLADLDRAFPPPAGPRPLEII
jgi:diketogulonate reductase-like aldo/keto reductase